MRILEGYGATETAPVAAVNTPMDYKVGTVGRLLPHLESRIEPVEGIDDAGRLHLRGANIMLGYLLADNAENCNPPNLFTVRVGTTQAILFTSMMTVF